MNAAADAYCVKFVLQKLNVITVDCAAYARNVKVVEFVNIVGFASNAKNVILSVFIKTARQQPSAVDLYLKLLSKNIQLLLISHVDIVELKTKPMVRIR
jgi:hypothetical protein